MSDTEVPEKKRRSSVRSLHSAEDIKRLLAKLIRLRLANDETVTNETLRAVVPACGTFLKACEAADLDTRLSEIEKKLAAVEGGRR